MGESCQCLTRSAFAWVVLKKKSWIRIMVKHPRLIMMKSRKVIIITKVLKVKHIKKYGKESTKK